MMVRLTILFACLVGLGCQSSPTAPEAFQPNCIGHSKSFIDVRVGDDVAVRAIWTEAPDSSIASLITDASDTVRLVRRDGFWDVTHNSILYYGDVHVTHDSVVIGAHGVDAGIRYYLKRL